MKKYNPAKWYIILLVFACIMFAGIWFYDNYFEYLFLSDYDKCVYNIEKGAHKYVEDNKNSFVSEGVNLKVEDLVNLGYVKANSKDGKTLVNPDNKLPFNGYVYAYIEYDKIIAYYTEEEVEKYTPIASEFSIIEMEKSSSSISIEVSADAQNALYSYAIDYGKYSSYTQDNTYAFNNIRNGSHTIKVKIQLENGDILYKTKVIQTIIIDKPQYSLKGNTMTIYFPDNEGNYIYEYSLDGKKTYITSAKQMVSFDISNEQTINARVFDGYNYVEAQEYKVGEDNTKTYTITFNLNGGEGSISNQIISANTNVKKPVDPVKEGYTFVGWYKGAFKFNFDTKINDNITLDAKWDSSYTTYKVSFDSEGGTSVNAVYVKENESASKPITPTKKGYVFMGWTKDGKIFDFTSKITSNITLKASWNKISESTKTYVVQFNSNEGTTIKTQVVNEGGKVQKVDNPVKEGYTFTYWSSDGKEYNFNNSVNKDLILVANYSKNKSETTYTVTFDSNKGSGVDDQKVVKGQKANAPSQPVRSGYTFSGWLLNGKMYDFNSPVNSNITLTASWVIISTNLSYDVTFYDGNDKRVVNVKSDNIVSTPKNPQKEGYVFMGWYSNGKKYDFTTKVNNNTTLRALWSPVINYEKETQGKWIYINNPSYIAYDNYLADSDKGSSSLYKDTFAGNAEISFSHNTIASYTKNTYYALRLYNPSNTSINLKINKCGSSSSNDAQAIKQYYNNTCNVYNTSYIIPSKKSLYIYKLTNGFKVSPQEDTSDVSKISLTFNGIINMTSSDTLYVSAIAFNDVKKTSNATYDGNKTQIYLNKIMNTRYYSGFSNYMPTITNNVVYDVEDETQKGWLPISYYDSNNTLNNSTSWVTNNPGGYVNTSSGTGTKQSNVLVNDYFSIDVPTSYNSSTNKVTSSFSLSYYPHGYENRDNQSIYGKTIKGYPYNWSNNFVHYNEVITINNNSNSDKTISFIISDNARKKVIGINCDGKYLEFNSLSYPDNIEKSMEVWSYNIAKGKSKKVSCILTLTPASTSEVKKGLYMS